MEVGSAVHEHDDVSRASQGFRERPRGVDVDHVESSRCPESSAVRYRRADALCYQIPLAWGQLSHKLNAVLLSGGFQYIRMGVDEGNVEVINI